MTTIKAIRIERTGGPEAMTLREVELGAPKPGEITVRAKAIGVNFIDTYHRSGLYPLPLPSGIGMEASGIVEAVGEGVTQFKPGDSAAYASGPAGAYAEANNVAAASAVKLPDGFAHEQAAAMMLKGLTAQFLLRQTFRVEKGQTILWHAAQRRRRKRRQTAGRQAASASSPANGRNISAPPSSARQAPARRQRSPVPMAATM